LKKLCGWYFRFASDMSGSVIYNLKKRRISSARAFVEVRQFFFPPRSLQAAIHPWCSWSQYSSVSKKRAAWGRLGLAIFFSREGYFLAARNATGDDNLKGGQPLFSQLQLF
jgi:hypothetical protein